MDLFTQAEAGARELKAQGLSDRADLLENAVTMFKACLPHKMPASLTGLNSALDEISPLPKKITIMRKEILQREVEALGLILQKGALYFPAG